MSSPATVTVLFPADCLARRAAGRLVGFCQDAGRVLNVTGVDEDGSGSIPRGGRVLGTVGHGTQPPASPGGSSDLIGHYNDEGVEFSFNGSPARVELYGLVQDVFSRNRGILETGRMLETSVIVSGCGSVGSLIALELARTGVGRFLLIDPESLSYENICRHQCGIDDVGRSKAVAVRDRILNINPRAEVLVCPDAIQRVPKEVFDVMCTPESILLGCGDNREADLYANRIACLYRVPLVSIGLWERAFAGEVFWTIPGELPCYYCLFGERGFEFSARQTSNRRMYTTEEDASRVQFEPGIHLDIGFVTTIGAKIAVDLLNRGAAGWHDRVLGSLQQFTLICNAVDPAVGGELAELFDHSLQITRSIVAERLPECPHCSVVGAEVRASA